MEYPKLKREKLIKDIYLAFIQLREIKGAEVKDTLTVYMDNNLEIWVDIDKDDKPCGIEINYHHK